MAKKATNILDTIVGLIIGIPIALLLVIVCSPVILYLSVVKGPIFSFKRRKFLKRNSGKILLCISPGAKYKELQSAYNDEIKSLGVYEIVVFDPTKPNNQYDGFDWDTMISRNLGFPILVNFNTEQIIQESLKSEFRSYFKKEIDWIELKSCIKGKVDGKNY